MAAAVCAMLVANSPFSQWYDMLLDVPVAIRIGALEIAKPLILWINDGLMAIFFFMVGLELKREIMAGELSDPSSVALPLIGAAGGIIAPVGIYTWFNAGNPDAMAGWAIPAATDIAFALGVLKLFGSRVPVALKVFLVSIAIFDDIAAIVIIAVFYSGDLSLHALGAALACIVVLFAMNRRGVSSNASYFLVGLIMWTALLKSGVHATLAGVALAAFIPMQARDEPGRSPLRELESDLHHLVAFAILPIFAFANAGIPFERMGIGDLLHPVSAGIILGLFAGKQLGVASFCWVAIRLGIAKMPGGLHFGMLYGASALCGIGFTMSMFIGSLAFESGSTSVDMFIDERLGIVAGSLLSALLAAAILHMALPKAARHEAAG